MRRLAAILALVLGLTLLAAPPVSAAVAAHAENHASGSAAGLTTLIGIEARLSEEAVRENASLGYDLASDDAVAAKRSGTRPGDLPARGRPNSSESVDKGNGGGTIRDYGPDGRAKTDYDFGHDHPTRANPQGAGDPHAHDWDWSKPSRERQPPRPLRPGE